MIRSCVTCKGFLPCDKAMRFYRKVRTEVPGLTMIDKVRRGELMDAMARQCPDYAPGEQYPIGNGGISTL